MPAPTRTPLGASTNVSMYYLDVNAGTHAAPDWTPVHGLTEFQPAREPTLQDDSDFDSDGWGSQTVTKLAWSLAFKVRRGVTVADPEAYDEGQEILRAAADALGQNNRVEVRYYEMSEDGPREEAYQGYAAVTWSPDGGAMDALNMVSVTLTGQGALSAITHPSPKS